MRTVLDILEWEMMPFFILVAFSKKDHRHPDCFSLFILFTLNAKEKT